MSVKAITPIQHGEADGSITNFKIGDDLGELDEDTQRSLVLGESAVEIGSDRKFTTAVVGDSDEDTILRDSLIAKSNSGVEDLTLDQNDSGVSSNTGSPAPKVPTSSVKTS